VFKLEKVFQNDDHIFINLYNLINSLLVFFSIYFIAILENNYFYEFTNYEIFKVSDLYEFSFLITFIFFISQFSFPLKKRYKYSYLNFFKTTFIHFFSSFTLSLFVILYFILNFFLSIIFFYIFFFIFFFFFFFFFFFYLFFFIFIIFFFFFFFLSFFFFFCFFFFTISPLYYLSIHNSPGTLFLHQLLYVNYSMKA